jgi:hypothetical protein
MTADEIHELEQQMDGWRENTALLTIQKYWKN